MMDNVMIDIETFGDKSNSVIVSLGAVAFDIETGEMGDEFYERIDIDSCLKEGLKVTGSTLKWWLVQNEAARKEVAKGGEELIGVLTRFARFISTVPNAKVWSNGLRFDISLLEDAYIKVDQLVPWEFRNERDVRTLVAFAPEIKSRIVNRWGAVLHNAKEDCKLQITYCTEIYKKLKIQ